MKKNLAKIVAAVATFLASAYPVYAADLEVDVLPFGFRKVTLQGLVQTLISVLIVAAFLIAFIVLLIGGVRWMTAGGDPKGVEGARNMVTAALIGLVIVLAAFALIRLVEVLFGYTIISAPFTVPEIPTE